MKKCRAFVTKRMPLKLRSSKFFRAGENYILQTRMQAKSPKGFNRCLSDPAGFSDVFCTNARKPDSMIWVAVRSSSAPAVGNLTDHKVGILYLAEIILWSF